MSIEALWYQHQCPHAKKIHPADLRDKTVPLRLALGFTYGQAGFRSCGNMDGTTTWYWPRRTGSWWAISNTLHDEIFTHQKQAVETACRIHGGRCHTAQTADVLIRQIAALGGVTLTIDRRVSETLFPYHPAGDPLPRKLRARVRELLKERNACADENVRMIDWLLIEMALSTGGMKGKKS